MKILSLGAVLMDQVASVERFPGEDDEVFVPKLQLLPGGSAANFAVYCSRLGEKSGFLGKVGDDEIGKLLREDLKKEGVDTGRMVVSKLPSGTVFIAVRGDGQKMMFAHSGAANNLKQGDIDFDYLNTFDHLHLADLENVETLIHAAKNFKGTVSLSPGALIADRRDLAIELLKDVDIIICSEGEAKKLSKKYDIDESIKELYTMGPKVIVVTRGSKTVKAFDGKHLVDSPVFKVTPVDTTGAGDSFSAGFICEYLKTADLNRALRFGSATAAMIIQHPGARTGVLDRAHVEDFLSSQKELVP